MRKCVIGKLLSSGSRTCITYRKAHQLSTQAHGARASGDVAARPSSLILANMVNNKTIMILFLREIIYFSSIADLVRIHNMHSQYGHNPTSCVTICVSIQCFNSCHACNERDNYIIRILLTKFRAKFADTSKFPQLRFRLSSEHFFIRPQLIPG